MPIGARAPKDGPIAVVACVTACVAAYGVYLGLPLILGALASQLGFSDAQIGWIGSAENGGLLLGSLAVSWLARSRRFRTIATLGMPIAILGDLAMWRIQSFPAFLTIRLCAGFGGGLCYSAAIAALSRTRPAARNFSIFVFVLVIANSVELWLIPPIVSHWSVHGLYTILAALYLVPLALASRIPDQGSGIAAESGTARQEPSHGAPLGWICLVAIVLFNVAASAFWAYAERIGASIELSEKTVSSILTICNLVSMTGSMLAYAMSRRWGQHRPQLAATALMIAVFSVWTLWLTPFLFVLGILIFFEVWSTVNVYQLGTLTTLDASGRRVALVPAAQGIGQSAGPSLAAALIALRFNYPQILLAATLFAVGSLVAYAIVYSRLRRLDPALAHA